MKRSKRESRGGNECSVWEAMRGGAMWTRLRKVLVKEERNEERFSSHKENGRKLLTMIGGGTRTRSVSEVELEV